MVAATAAAASCGMVAAAVYLQWSQYYYIPLVYKPYVNWVILSQDYIP